MLPIPIKSSYNLIDRETLFYPALVQLYRISPVDVRSQYISRRNVHDYMDIDDSIREDYEYMVDNLDDMKAAKIMHLIFGRPGEVFNRRSDKYQNVALLEHFAMYNHIETDEVYPWYSGSKPNSKMIEAVKRFLRIGFLYLEYNTNNSIQYKDTLIRKYSGYNNIVFIDGDNLYFHISPLFRIFDNEYYFIFFSKRNNISEIFSSYYHLLGNPTSIDIITSFDTKKDAADVNLNLVSTYIRDSHLSEDYDTKNFYVLTGDQYAVEICALSNYQIGVNIRDLASNFSWLNAQPLFYNGRNWSFQINSIDNRIFGEILPKEYEHRMRFDRYNINLFLSSNQNRNYDPMCTPYLINLIKERGDLALYGGYKEVQDILSDESVHNFDSFSQSISNRPQEKRRDLLESYLVLVGAKYFTRSELLFNFLPHHVSFVSRLFMGNELDRYTLENDELIEFLNLPVNKLESLGAFYQFSNVDELFYRNIDIPISLKIKYIQFENEKIKSILISRS